MVRIVNTRGMDVTGLEDVSGWGATELSAYDDLLEEVSVEVPELTVAPKVKQDKPVALPEVRKKPEVKAKKPRASKEDILRKILEAKRKANG